MTEPDALLPEAHRYAALLAAKPISSLVHTKAAIVAPFRQQIEAARARESASFADLMGGPANAEALAAFAEKRKPHFKGWDDPNDRYRTPTIDTLKD